MNTNRRNNFLLTNEGKKEMKTLDNKKSKLFVYIIPESMDRNKGV